MGDPDIIDLSPEQFAARRNAGELWQLVDVREPWEIEIAAIEDSIRIPMGDMPARFGELDLESPIAVLCHGGVRSARIADWLLSVGAHCVANIDGGIDAWSQTVDRSIPRY